MLHVNLRVVFASRYLATDGENSEADDNLLMRHANLRKIIVRKHKQTAHDQLHDMIYVYNLFLDCYWFVFAFMQISLLFVCVVVVGFPANYVKVQIDLF